jgi:hypothetical protein
VMELLTSRSVDAAALWMLFEGNRIEHALHTRSSCPRQL